MRPCYRRGLAGSGCARDAGADAARGWSGSWPKRDAGTRGLASMLGRLCRWRAGPAVRGWRGKAGRRLEEAGVPGFGSWAAWAKARKREREKKKRFLLIEMIQTIFF